MIRMVGAASLHCLLYSCFQKLDFGPIAYSCGMGVLCVFAGNGLDFFTNGFAGGGSRQFNRFLAELTARADLFATKAAHGLVGDDDVCRSESTFKLDKPQGWAIRSYGSG